jgi:glycosyltransferase involved in cell wall biosynthesis
MRIVIDLQACQSTGSRHRGIGRYSLSLAKEMIKNAQQHEVHLLLNARFSDTLEIIKNEFEALIPHKHFHIFGTLERTEDAVVENFWRARASELIREQALQNLHPDVVHVSSLFEGFGDAAITSINQNFSDISTAVTLYDLIPLIHANAYLDFPPLRSWYLRKAQSLKAANLVLAISESSKREGENWLHIPEHRIVNISSGVDSRFERPVLMEKNEVKHLLNRYQLTRPFVMYTGGIDLRKNIERLIQAFAALPIELRNQYQLAIVCSVQDVDRKRLGLLADRCGLRGDDLVLTGFVPDDDLPVLYQTCELFVFPSWHEGFGLPALEAMASGAATIAANTSSLPEVIGWEDATFDPYKIESITAKIYQALTDIHFKRALIEHGKKQASKFSWERSAKKAIEAFEQDFDEKEKSSSIQISNLPRFSKSKLAFFSPLPKAHSGIADYSAELIPELALYYDITLIVDGDKVEEDWLNANFQIRSYSWFEQNFDYFDRIIYNVGNSAFHTKMYDMIGKYPGVMVLHDFFLSGLVGYLDASQMKPSLLAQTIYESHGYRALIELQATKEFESIIWKYPCNLPLIKFADGVIVHSEFSKEMANTWYGEHFAREWKKVSFLRAVPAIIDRRSARSKLGFSDADFIVCSFGIAGPTKLNLELLEAWLGSTLVADKSCHLILVGRNDGNLYGQKIAALIKRSGGQIKITGFADAEIFRQYLAAADVAVQLRGISRGETSGAILDCLAHGIPTIVNRNGAANELPEDVVVSLPDTFTIEELREKLYLLRSDDNLRARMSSQARFYVQTFHAPSKVGYEYYLAMEDFFAKSNARRLQQTAKKISAISVSTSIVENDLIAVAQALADNSDLQTTVPRVFLALDNLLEVAEQGEQIKDGAAVRLFLISVLNSVPAYLRIEPVITSRVGGRVRFARGLTKSLFGLDLLNLDDDIVDVKQNDLLVDLFDEKIEQQLSRCVWPKECTFNKKISYNLNLEVNLDAGGLNEFDVGALFWRYLSSSIDEIN